jgi:RNA polymerase-binding transcription factor DksA
MEPDTAPTAEAPEAPEAPEAVHAATVPAAAPALDLDGIERDLADVEVALARLDAGTYWTDEVTGQPLDEHHLGEHPTARRAAG